MRRVVLLVLLGGCQALFRLDHVPASDAPTSDTVGSDGSGGCGVFRPRADYPAMSMPASLVVVDVDHDGRLDVVVGSVIVHSVQAFENTGSGFMPGPISDTTIAPAAMASGLFSGADNLPDLVVVNVTDTLHLMANNGSFTFVGGNAVITTSPTAIAAGDYSGDGHSDVVVTDTGNNQVHLYTGNGAGVLAPGGNGMTDPGPSAIVEANLDGDTHADFVVADAGGAHYTTIIGSTGQLASGTLDDVPVAVAVADLDGDGLDDPIFALVGMNQIEAVLSTSRAQRVSATTGFGPSKLVAADFDGDQHPDVAFYDANSMVIVEMHGNGDGTFGDGTEAGEHVIQLPALASALGVGDFNGDGRPDLAVAMGDMMPVLAIFTACP